MPSGIRQSKTKRNLSVFATKTLSLRPKTLFFHEKDIKIPFHTRINRSSGSMYQRPEHRTADSAASACRQIDVSFYATQIQTRAGIEQDEDSFTSVWQYEDRIGVFVNNMWRAVESNVAFKIDNLRQGQTTTRGRFTASVKDTVDFRVLRILPPHERQCRPARHHRHPRI